MYDAEIFSLRCVATLDEDGRRFSKRLSSLPKKTFFLQKQKLKKNQINRIADHCLLCHNGTHSLLGCFIHEDVYSKLRTHGIHVHVNQAGRGACAGAKALSHTAMIMHGLSPMRSIHVDHKPDMSMVKSVCSVVTCDRPLVHIPVLEDQAERGRECAAAEAPTEPVDY
eukprot:GHVQ01030745.1.p1 GENE.GHVQ01030745.1~~GHVQ01030745.1.p1  ORF type:complete len:168 (-),score=11.06 GHVQ01030745.1:329-832(-)